MAELYYFPLLAGDWLAGEAISAMLPEQEGAFIHLLCMAWRSTHEVACSLPADDAALADLSRLRARWKKLGPLVRAQFDVVEDHPDRIRNPKLWGIWLEFQSRHARRVSSGRSGGKAKAEGKQSPSNATAMPEQGSSNPLANGKQSESESKEEIITAREVSQLVACANRGLREHVNPELRAEIPTIMAASGSSLEAAQAIMAAGIPFEFAERELYEAGRTTKSGKVRSLNYLVPVVVQAWHRAQASTDANAVTVPARNGQPKRELVVDKGRWDW